MNIYIHIPFCKTRCSYCDFFSVTGINKKVKILESINKEIRERVQNEYVTNIYLGGGTPSLLSVKEIVEIFNTIYKNNIISDIAEITLEANPDDLNEAYISEIVQYTPVNRFSIGVQSFINEDLEFLNRRHNDMDVYKAVENLRHYGVNNISMDLIYGLPNQTKEKWEYNIKRMLNLNPEHISAYHLTYEKGTPLYNKLKKGDVSEVDENDSIIFYYILTDLLKKSGYRQYEISNFCKDGYHARLNSDYWNGSPYIGIGPSAHSYDGEKIRRLNYPVIKTYIENVGINDKYFSLEYLSDEDIINEFLMTRLRTENGIRYDDLIKIVDERTYKGIISKAKKYSDSNHIEINNENFRLTHQGILISDKIISDFFV